MSWLRDFAGMLLLAGGLLFTALAVFGLFRMPDVYTRMHAGSKVVAIGAPMLLLGVALVAQPEVGLQALAILGFLFLTAPSSTFASARAAHRRREPMTERTVIDELELLRHRDRDEEKEPYEVD